MLARVLPMLLLSLLAAGCQTKNDPNTRIETQVVKVPVPVDAPAPKFSQRQPLPSSTLPADEPHRALKGDIMNYQYLIDRIDELEGQLKQYQTQQPKEAGK